MTNNETQKGYVISTDELFVVLGVIDFDQRLDFLNKTNQTLLRISEKIHASDPTYRVDLDRFIDNFIPTYLSEELGEPIYSLDRSIVYELIDRQMVVKEIGTIVRHIQNVLMACNVVGVRCYIGGIVLYGVKY